MSDEPDITKEFKDTSIHVSEFRRFLRVFLSRKIVVFGLVVITLLVLTAIFAPLVAPFDPYKINPDNQLRQPNWQNLLGTT